MKKRKKTAKAVRPKTEPVPKAKPTRKVPEQKKSAKAPVAPEAPAPRAERELVVVALGASAGGLEALQHFFGAVPRDSGIAFVIVTHQHPGHVTMLPELLSKHAPIPVRLGAEGTKLEPNCAYVAPAGGPLSIDAGVLHIANPERAVHMPIDHFFRSLARDRGEDAIAVVLSGTGSDGTLGIAEIKASGGFVMAQDAASARYASMPTSAADTHLVDCVLSPEQMPGQLARYLERRRHDPLASPDSTGALHRVLYFLRSRTGHDFTAYKKSTLSRRVQRRMDVHNLESVREYVRYLEQTPRESEILLKELLISVTNFFRDRAPFEALRVELRKQLERREEERPVRVWVPACATGEEAYTVAILIKEILAELGKTVPVQIFATDLDQQAIDFARAGHYPHGIAADLSDEQLARFFVKGDQGYRVNKEIRESIVFAGQNLIRDPPFTKLDLLSCRNLLIYLEPELQRRVISLFSYALRPSGLLLLGSSETIAGFDAAFVALDKKSKIFARRERRTEPPPDFLELSAPLPGGGTPQLRSGHSRAGVGVSMLVDRILQAHFVPPSVLVNERGDIAYFHGSTGQFLEPASGEPNVNVFGMVREGLRLELPAALREASRGQDPVVRAGLPVKSNGGLLTVKLTIRRLQEPDPVRGMFLVSFELEPPPEPREKAEGRAQKRELGRIGQLERELKHSQENLQGTIEELETSNEELKSTNEELQSTNEELQSANEELETSREELQSLNEELQTVNSELEERNHALTQANDDMQNLLNSTEIATVFLDANLVIKRFTSQAVTVFRLIDADIGRPISDLSANLRYDGLVEDAREVLRSLVFREREIQTKEGAWRMMRIMPYRTAENVIDGLVMTFIDIDRLKRDEQATTDERRFIEEIWNAIPYGVIALDGELRILDANQRFLEFFRTNRKRVIGEPLRSVSDGLLDTPEIRAQLLQLFDDGPPLEGERLSGVDYRFPSRDLVVHARRYSSGDTPLVVLSFAEFKQ